jgi:hypothetical protein
VGENGPRIAFDQLPFPRHDGTFDCGSGRVVVMTASSSNLEEAEIKAVGEQLMDVIAPRLAAPPEGVEPEEAMLRAWFPLDKWLWEFILEGNASAQWLDDINPIARETHLRRIWVMDPDLSFHASQIGRACSFETPEGPNCGRVLTLARGASVRDGRIVPAAGRDEDTLGLSASLVPLLCHNDPNRQLMGANMIRQMVPPDEPEAPLVQSGLEPEDGSAWLGRNLLTAFCYWKGMNYEDAIVVSESAARKLASRPWGLEVGDKLANRHGCKGVVGAVLRDDDMPHLPDGRPVELVFDAMGLHSRLNFGQVLEATLGLIAEKRGQPEIAPPFRRTTPGELHAMLRGAGLPESGQFTLRDGKDGSELEELTTAGVVYWGRLVHLARAKIHAVGAGEASEFHGQRTGSMEYEALKAARAQKNILDAYGTRAVSPEQSQDLAAGVASGFLAEAAEAPSPLFRRAQRALRAAMIELAYEDGEVRVGWATPTPSDVELAEPVEHTWQPERMLTHVGPKPLGDDGAYDRVLAANDRLRQATRAGSGEASEPARQSLRQALEALFERLETRRSSGSPLPPPGGFDTCAVEFSTRSLFTGRSVLAPGYGLRLGQVGLPEDIAWPLFGALVASQVGAEHTAERGYRVKRAIERAMQASMIVINRAPTLEPTSVTAFEPVMAPGNAILLHPLCCRLFNADFDGDQAAVWLPVSRSAQAEARERLSLTGHLQRDPTVVVGHLAPGHSLLAGLACALESAEGRAAFEAAWPTDCEGPVEPLTRPKLVAALLGVMEALGPERLLDLVERLYRIGDAWATKSGASLSPFVGEALTLPRPPTSEAGPAWHAYASMVEEVISSRGESDPTLRAPLRAVRSGARGSVHHLRALVGPLALADPYETNTPATHGYRDGLTAAELWPVVSRSRRSLQAIWQAQERRAAGPPSAESGSVLRRAMVASRPGRVFAEAAENGEVDPLTGPDVRLWVGLLPLHEGE